MAEAKDSTQSSSYKHFHSPKNDAFYNGGYYESLDPENKEIRLLAYLKPDDPSDGNPPRFSLRQRIPLSSVGDGFAYVSVSYRAGNPNDTRPIVVDGEVFNAFRPLAESISRIAGQLSADGNTDTILFWADQVCINQSDDVEKASQVAMMREIYEGAAWTYCWLGTDPEVSKGLHHLREFNALQGFIEKTCEKGGEPWTREEWLDDVGNVANMVPGYFARFEREGMDWEAVRVVMSDPYWHRGWICQEILVSKDVTINTDTEETDREGFTRAMRVFEAMRRMVRWFFRLEGEELVLKDDQPWDMSLVEPLREKVQKLRWLYDFNIEPFEFYTERRARWDSGEKFRLDELMMLGRQTKVTDPLDKVYAFVGLADDMYEIVPDYSGSQTAAKAYMQASRACIKAHRALDLLCYAEEKSEGMRDQLPSWVPDWSLESSTHSLWHRVAGDPAASPRAAGLTGYEASFHPGPDGERDVVLGASAIVVDYVADSPDSIGSTMGSYENWDECFAAWLSVARLDPSSGDCEVNTAAYPHAADTHMALAFWMTLMRGISPTEILNLAWNKAPKSGDPTTWTDKNKPADGEGEGGASWFARITNSKGSTAGLAPQHIGLSLLVDRMYMVRAGWRFLRTRDGYFALTKAAVEPGDVVAVLIGADMPFVLRPYRDGYKLVGEIYVHGIMQGRIMEELEAGEGEWSVDDILIY